jgi:hypothetical protein
VSGKIVYTPEDTYNGADSFGYTMTDGHGSTASAQVSVTILSKNDPPETPVVSSPKEGDRAGGSSKVKVEWTCFDIDGDTLTYTLEYYDGKAGSLKRRASPTRRMSSPFLPRLVRRTGASSALRPRTARSPRITATREP